MLNASSNRPKCYLSDRLNEIYESMMRTVWLALQKVLEVFLSVLVSSFVRHNNNHYQSTVDLVSFYS